MKEIESEKYIKKKLKSHNEYLGLDEHRRMTLITSDMYELQQAFEDGYECATKWIDVKNRLPERGCDVLVVIKGKDNSTYAGLRWRSEYNDVVVDENGFAIYPSEKEVIAWLPIPDIFKITNNK
jgi:hypothetical protein